VGNLDLAKFDHSCFHFSMFRWLELQGNDAVIRIYDEAGNVIETHEHAGDFKAPRLLFRFLVIGCASGCVV
jgi:hypothetical protein